MCKLSIITINYNNAKGLEKTISSVLSQSSSEFEYIIIDGDSCDDSKKIIEEISKSTNKQINWISEKDNGIYHAMNKGIRMSQGEYVQFLNSGDCLVADNVVEVMLSKLSTFKYPAIIYGNMLKEMPKGLLRDKGFEGRQPTMIDFYLATLNHSSAYIHKSLFDKFGLYDESLNIVSDWKWFLTVIIFGNVNIYYVDIDVTLFDMNGISTVNTTLDKNEREKVLQDLLPSKIILDYSKYALAIRSWERIQRNSLSSRLFYFIERVLFKIEKQKNRLK